MIFKRSTPQAEGLNITVGDQNFCFGTPAEFEFALNGRTCVPSAKIAALVDVPDEELLKEAEDIKKVERRMADALSGVLEDSSKINQVLKQVDLSLISNDNEWRSIISDLMEVPPSFERYKKIALVKYMQYLVSRQEIVKGLYLHRQIHKAPDDKHDGGAANGESNPKETALFDHANLEPDSKGQQAYRRLPKGETLELSLEHDEIFTFLVSRHECAIVMRDRLFFIDSDGREISLPKGRSIVGRDGGADIVLQPKMRDVSRKHLLIESEGTDVVRVTDISSHGTWVHPRYLDCTEV